MERNCLLIKKKKTQINKDFLENVRKSKILTNYLWIAKCRLNSAEVRFKISSGVILK